MSLPSIFYHRSFTQVLLLTTGLHLAWGGRMNLTTTSLNITSMADTACSLVKYETQVSNSSCFLESECEEQCRTVEDQECHSQLQEVCNSLVEVLCETVQVGGETRQLAHNINLPDRRTCLLLYCFFF